MLGRFWAGLKPALRVSVARLAGLGFSSWRIARIVVVRIGVLVCVRFRVFRAGRFWLAGRLSRGGGVLRMRRVGFRRVGFRRVLFRWVVVRRVFPWWVVLMRGAGVPTGVGSRRSVGVRAGGFGRPRAVLVRVSRGWVVPGLLLAVGRLLRWRGHVAAVLSGGACRLCVPGSGVEVRAHARVHWAGPGAVVGGGGGRSGPRGLAEAGIRPARNGAAARPDPLEERVRIHGAGVRLLPPAGPVVPAEVEVGREEAAGAGRALSRVAGVAYYLPGADPVPDPKRALPLQVGVVEEVAGLHGPYGVVRPDHHRVAPKGVPPVGVRSRDRDYRAVRYGVLRNAGRGHEVGPLVAALRARRAPGVIV